MLNHNDDKYGNNHYVNTIVLAGMVTKAAWSDAETALSDNESNDSEVRANGA